MLPTKVHNYVYKMYNAWLKPHIELHLDRLELKANVFSFDFSTTPIGKWTGFFTRNRSRELYETNILQTVL